MTIFAKKSFTGLDWIAVQDQIGVLQMSLMAPHDLMMFSRKRDDRGGDDIYIGLPDKALLRAFPGFVEVQRSDLPEYMSTLVVREDGFAELFPDIAAKRNAADEHR